MLKIKSIHILFAHTTWRAVYCNNTLLLFPPNRNVTLVCVIWSVTTTAIITYNMLWNMSCLNLSFFHGSPAQEMVTNLSGFDFWFYLDEYDQDQKCQYWQCTLHIIQNLLLFSYAPLLDVGANRCPQGLGTLKLPSLHYKCYLTLYII